MTDTAALEERKAEREQHKRVLTQAETKQASAEAEIADLEKRLRDQGFDPDGDLGGQIAAQENRLHELIGTIDGLLGDVQAQLAGE